MRKFILVLILILLVSIGASSQTITLVPVGGAGVSSIDVEVEHYTPGGTTGTITSVTSNIPTDRGQTSNVIFSTANSDQGSVGITFPSGYGYTIGTTNYTTATLHANAWMAFPSSTYNGYNSSASAPNVSTIHFTSVNNGSTDNNMSHVSWETYNDATYGDVYRLRYEGSYKYNVSGINTKIDLYFFKNDLNKCMVVLRQFLADGSNQEQIGLSNGSTWLASNMITNATYSNGVAFMIDNASTTGTWVSQGVKTTNSAGQVTFTNSSNLNYRVSIDVANEPSIMSAAEMDYLMYMKAGIQDLTDWDYYTCDTDGSTVFDWNDIIEGYNNWTSGLYHNSDIFTQSQKVDIEGDPAANQSANIPAVQQIIATNQNQFYIVARGKHKTTINNLNRIQ